MIRTLWLVALVGLVISQGVAVDTESWRQSSFEEFMQGKRERIALRSDGLMTLSPELKELQDSSADAVWALALDSKGNIYTAAPAPEAGKLRVSRIPAGGGEVEKMADVEGLTCFSIAVDRQDRVYIGVSPQAKIFRFQGNTPEFFAEPSAAYIWAMAFDSKQNLYAATGDKGVIYKIDSRGQASVFVETEETHVRSLIVDSKDQLYAGSAPGGLVMRITPAGESFVVYQADREEITSLAVNAGGDLLLAAAGSRRSVGPRPSLLTPQSQALPPPAGQSSGAPQVAAGAAPPSPRPSSPTVPRPAIAGGSDVIRIGRDGFPETVWESEREIAYALAIDSNDRGVIATGNEGGLYRLEAEHLYTSLLQAQAEQITAVLPLPSGGIVFATSNIGKVLQAGPALAQNGVFESDVFDSEFFARWGRVTVEGKAEDGSLLVSARSGNVNRPQKNWSEWSSTVGVGAEGEVSVPAARYYQWRAELKRAGSSPELHAVDVAYRSKNMPPRIVTTEATPPNHSFPPRLLSISPSDKLTLQPLAAKSRPRSSPLSTGSTSSLSMNYGKGFVGVRWLAEDENQDDLCYRLEIRSVGSPNWLPLAKDLEEPQYSWDSNAWPDGRYEVRITVSDKKSNVPDEALESTAVTDPFLIDNTKPQIEGLSAKWNGSQIAVTWSATDERSPVRRAQYSLNGEEWTRVEPENGLSDATTLRYALQLPGRSAGAAAHPAPGAVLAVRVTDEFDNEAVLSIGIPAR